MEITKTGARPPTQLQLDRLDVVQFPLVVRVKVVRPKHRSKTWSVLEFRDLY